MSVSVGSKAAAERAVDVLENVKVTATTLPTGANATASSRYDGNNLVLDLGLPRGPQGSTTFPNMSGTKGNILGFVENNNVAPMDMFSSGTNHRNIYRGKKLGSSVSSSQYAAISAGTFDDLYIGDYWTINGTDYLIADLDYWYNTGDTSFTKHHAVIVPRLNIGENKQMNSSNTTDNAYYGSEMYSTNLNDAKTKITTDFGDAHILSHKILLENAVKDGYPSGYLWVNSKIDLMSETMVYGTRHYAPMGTGLVTPVHYTVDKTQLALFKLYPQAITLRQHYWLRDVINTAGFAGVYADGTAYANAASATYVGVHPAFAIGV